MGRRLIAVFCLLVAAAGGVMARIWAIGESDEFRSAANVQSSKTITLYESRAEIYDRNLKPFTNRTSGLYAAVMPCAENMDAVIKSAVADVREKFAGGAPFTVRLKYEIQAAGVYTYNAPERYDDNQEAAHVIGCVNSEGAGISGIERAYDGFLRENGVKKALTYSVNGAGVPIGGAAPKTVSSGSGGAGVVLTLDRAIQRIAETEGAKRIKKGAVVITDAKTGEIRALASFPSFSQNDLSASVNDIKNAPMINRALSAFAVGSTFKISTAIAALESGVPTARSCDCLGKITVGGQVFNCHDRAGHGMLDMKGAMAVSCNPYFISLAQKIDIPRLLNTARDLSFGKSCRLAEGMISDSGTLPSETDMQNAAERGNFGFGQGKLTGTPLQVNMMTLCVLNGGRTLQPRLVKGTVDGENMIETEMPSGMRAMSEATAKTVKEFLDAAVMRTDNQQARPINVTAGGKTATAQTTGNGDNEKLNAWFTGYFPAGSPKYAVTVLCEDGYTGNLSAGPVFRRIADEITAYEGAEK